MSKRLDFTVSFDRTGVMTTLVPKDNYNKTSVLHPNQFYNLFTFFYFNRDKNIKILMEFFVFYLAENKGTYSIWNKLIFIGLVSRQWRIYFT